MRTATSPSACAGSPPFRCEGKPLFRRLVLVAFFIEVGLLLIVLPWSMLWERNYFMERYAMVHAVATNLFVRGAVSGVGAINLVAGFVELIPIFATRGGASVAFGDEADTQVRP